MTTRKSFLKLNLQKFAEPGQTDPPQTPPANDPKQTDPPGTTDEPKYTDAEVNALFDKKFAKLKKQMEDERKAAEAEKLKEIEEAEKLAKMNVDEKTKYENEKLRKEIEELKKKEQHNALAKEAAKMLKEKSIDADETLLSILVRDTADETKEVVESFAALLGGLVADGIQEALTGRAPKVNTTTPGLDNPFAKATLNLTKQAQLKKDNPELYAQMKAAAAK